MNQLEAYRKAYLLALDNAEIWLDLAREAFNKKHFGQTYAMVSFANEEIVKAYISWGVSQEYIEPNDEVVKAVFRWHIDKGMISLDFHYEILVQEALRFGLINEDEALAAIVTSSPEQVVEELREHAEEMEERRKAGVYVERPMMENGNYLVTSPADFPKTRAENWVEMVDIFHKSVKLMLEAIERDDKIREWFESRAKEIAQWKSTEEVN